MIAAALVGLVVFVALAVWANRRPDYGSSDPDRMSEVLGRDRVER